MLVGEVWRRVVQVFGTFPRAEARVFGRQAAEDWVPHSSSPGLILPDG